MNKRIIGIDIIKVLAFLFVICLHFTNYYYVNTLNNLHYIIYNSFHWLFFSCIGLFILITGYLNYSKDLNKKYYIKFFELLLTFLVYSIITGLVVNPLGNQNFFEYLFGIFKYYFLNYNAYFWYANFYLSFYFLIPFLGIINKNINKKQHLLLIVLLLFIIVIPNFINQFNDLSSRFGSLSLRGFNYFSVENFCFVYYFIGSYIKKYCNIKMNWKFYSFIVIALLVTLIIHSHLDLYYLNKYQYQFEFGYHVYTFHEYGNLFTIIGCVLIFLLLKNINFKNITINIIITRIANLSFELYLGLAVADKVVKHILNKCNMTLGMNLSSFIIWFILEFASTLLLAFIISNIKETIKKLIRYIKERKILYAK